MKLFGLRATDYMRVAVNGQYKIGINGHEKSSTFN